VLLYADALTVFDRFLAEKKVSPSQTVLMGRSLGPEYWEAVDRFLAAVADGPGHRHNSDDAVK